MANIQDSAVPTVSDLTNFIESQCQSEPVADISDHQALALQVMYDLQYQHDWSALDVHSQTSTSASNPAWRAPLRLGILRSPRSLAMPPRPILLALLLLLLGEDGLVALLRAEGFDVVPCPRDACPAS